MLPQEGGQTTTCTVSDDVKTKFKAFKTGKNQANNAFIMKINPNALEVVLEHHLENVSILDIAEELPESAPRYIAYSYKWVHDDGRVSFPLVFIFYCPKGINTKLNILYASTKPVLTEALQVQKLFSVATTEELTEEWLKDKLAFFK